MSSSKQFRVLQRAPIPTGTEGFEAQRTAILEEFASNVPQDLRLPSSIINNAPKSVLNVPRECGLLTPQEIQITESYDATALAEAIAARKVTAVQATVAFAKRAMIAHQLTCCLTEWFMDEAVKTAEALDNHLAETGKTVGPLQNVPLSIKEHLPIAGHWSMLGSLDTRQKDPKDCHIVELARAAGAVFYCKTNQPQSVMHLESVSIYGRVLNPYNINLSAGGSTGGEAALIAMRGSVLGIGGDIGGSIRGPSAFCGIYGYKPTSYYLPTKDAIPGGFAAELNVLAAPGPVCSSLRDMDLFMSSILDPRPYIDDPRLIPIPWTGLKGSIPAGRPLRVGFLMNDGAITPQPPVARAMDWARQKLEANPKFEVTTFEPFETARAMSEIRKAYFPDGGKGLKDHLASTGEPMFTLSAWAIKEAEGVELDTNGILKLRLDRDRFRFQLAEHWKKQCIDVVLSPAFVGPASEHDTAFYWNYTAFWNYVDYPGAVIPTPFTAQAKVQEQYKSAESLSEHCTHVRQLWDQGDFEGAPIGLQVIARKYHDNDLFPALQEIEKALHD